MGTRRQPPSLRRRRLAERLRTLRLASDMDIGDAAERAGFSRSKLSRVESLDLLISADDTDTLCRALGVDNDERARLVTLARHAKRRGWWQVDETDGDTLGVSTDLLELEDDCVDLRSYTDSVVPGCVQTLDYARAVIRSTSPTLDAATVDRQAQLRLERQDRMTRRGTEIWAVLDEAALTRTVGDPSIMAAQVEHLLELADSDTAHVSVQLLPHTSGGHVALGMPFKLLTLSDGATFTYVDALGGGLYLENDHEIEKHEYRWRVLAAQALPFDDTATHLERIASTHKQGSNSHARSRKLRVAKEQL